MKVINVNEVPSALSGPQDGVRHFYPQSSAQIDGELLRNDSYTGDNRSRSMGKHLVSQYKHEDEFCCKSDSVNVHLVYFPKGTRNRLHWHNREQVIIAVSGIGIQATKGGENVVKTGNLIYIPAGEAHWHGATKDSEFSQYSIFGGDRESHWVPEE